MYKDKNSSNPWLLWCVYFPPPMFSEKSPEISGGDCELLDQSLQFIGEPWAAPGERPSKSHLLWFSVPDCGEQNRHGTWRILKISCGRVTEEFPEEYWCRSQGLVFYRLKAESYTGPNSLNCWRRWQVSPCSKCCQAGFGSNWANWNLTFGTLLNVF